MGESTGVGSGGKLEGLLRSLYREVTLEVNWNSVVVDGIRTGKGLRQGCVLSPILFALYLKRLGDALQESGAGIMIGDVHMPGLFFADDVVLFADSPPKLQSLLHLVGEFCVSWRLKVHGAKSKVMIFEAGKNPRVANWMVSTVPIEVAITYKYLGVTFSSQGRWWGAWENHFLTSGRKMLGRLKRLAYSSCNVRWVSRALLENVAMAVLTYGCEVLPMSERVLK